MPRQTGCATRTGGRSPCGRATRRCTGGGSGGLRGSGAGEERARRRQQRHGAACRPSTRRGCRQGWGGSADKPKAIASGKGRKAGTHRSASKYVGSLRVRSTRGGGPGAWVGTKAHTGNGMTARRQRDERSPAVSGGAHERAPCVYTSKHVGQQSSSSLSSLGSRRAAELPSSASARPLPPRPPFCSLPTATLAVAVPPTPQESALRGRCRAVTSDTCQARPAEPAANVRGEAGSNGQAA
jgi:hypothetical protein